jgi:hypothetical protein
MAKETNVRYPEWIKRAVLRFAEKNKMGSFSKAVVFLVECELNRRNYYRTDYEPNITDEALTDDLKNPNEKPSEKEKKQEFRIKSLELENEKLKNQIKDAGISKEKHSPIEGMGKNRKKAL